MPRAQRRHQRLPAWTSLSFSGTRQLWWAQRAGALRRPGPGAPSTQTCPRSVFPAQSSEFGFPKPRASNSFGSSAWRVSSSSTFRAFRTPSMALPWYTASSHSRPRRGCRKRSLHPSNLAVPRFSRHAGRRRPALHTRRLHRAAAPRSARIARRRRPPLRQWRWLGVRSAPVVAPNGKLCATMPPSHFWLIAKRPWPSSGRCCGGCARRSCWPR
mmetsp:Transcript_7428/g.21099  ORF Transcript_7428/g.21099 Transcript_7428/m.21099 type:complete len:214 (-) Transcript_7428:352-993(-)